VLSAVDNRQYKRILYQGLDHDPNHADMQAFLGRLKEALDARELVLKGITTDGSALYPEAIRAVFREVPQQPCTFHVIAELVKGVRSAVATERKRLARKSKAMQEQIRDLFEGVRFVR